MAGAAAIELRSWPSSSCNRYRALKSLLIAHRKVLGQAERVSGYLQSCWCICRMLQGTLSSLLVADPKSVVSLSLRGSALGGSGTWRGLGRGPTGASTRAWRWSLTTSTPRVRCRRHRSSVRRC